MSGKLQSYSHHIRSTHMHVHSFQLEAVLNNTIHQAHYEAVTQTLSLLQLADLENAVLDK